MRWALIGPAVAAALLLAGCTPTVSLKPAPGATSVGCAGVVVRMPDSLGTVARRTTDAQGTAAWGSPASVTLTCGVTPPVTTDCTTIDGVDWLTQSRPIGGATWLVYTTYGRSPSTQLVVNPAAVIPDTVLRTLSDPIAAATARTGVRCLSAAETS
jgi:hypothetical protein